MSDIATKLTTIAENQQKVWDAGYAEGSNEGYTNGKQAEYDAFWDDFQDGGNRFNYQYGFSYGWTNDNFKPKYDIRPTGDYGAGQMFYNQKNGLDISAGLSHNGVSLDLSQATRWNGTFDRSNVTNIPPIDARSCTTMSTTFYSTTLSRLTIYNLRKDCTFDRTFSYMKGLVELFFYITDDNPDNAGLYGIGNNGIDLSSSPLTKDSLLNIINYLEAKERGTWALPLGADNLAKLTEAEIAIATEKRWSLA